MASTFTDILRLEKQGDGENPTTWGDILNAKVFDLVEDAIANTAAIDLTSETGTYTLSANDGAADEARCMALKLTGTLGANVDIECPAKSKVYVVFADFTNAGSFILTLGPVGGSSTITIDGAGDDLFVFYTDGTNSYRVDRAAKKQGKETIWVPASAMTPLTSSGPALLTQTEISAGAPELVSLDFDGTIAEYAQFSIAMPKSWNEGTVTAAFFWTADSTSSNSVVWAIQGVSISDGDAIAASYGTPIGQADAHNATANDLNVSPETSAITIGGSPAAGDLTFFKIYRAPGDASDTLTDDAKLLGVQLFFTTNAANDA